MIKFELAKGFRIVNLDWLECYQCFGNQNTVYSHFLSLRMFFWLLFYQMKAGRTFKFDAAHKLTTEVLKIPLGEK